MLLGEAWTIRLQRMEVRYHDADLERLEFDPDSGGKWGRDVVRAFRKCVWLIRAAEDERSLYQMRARRFEKLQGARSGQYSMRLNDQWRLIMVIEKASPKNAIRIMGIEDYHS